MPAKSMAKQGLPAEKHITEGLIAISMADTVRNECVTISAQWIPAMLYLNSLKQHAIELGYTASEIKTFIKDENEKERLLEVAETRFEKLGAVTDVPSSYCGIGMAEIETGSTIGKLLRVK
tara:strand:+ start:173 stop:535 length:363 start_codon:yes stop_codon:yes gene_type:complete